MHMTFQTMSSPRQICDDAYVIYHAKSPPLPACVVLLLADTALYVQVSSPSQAAARKQQHASSPAQVSVSVRQRRELEFSNEHQKQDIMR